MSRILPLLIALFLLRTPVPAQAAFDAAGAESLKKDIESSLSWYSEISQVTKQGVSHAGPVSVAVKGSFYEARIGGISITGANGFKLEIGDVVFNAVPGGPGEWIVSAALPRTMGIYDAAGAKIADVTIGSQRFSAVWLPASDALSKYDADYRDIVLTPHGATPYSLSIGSIVSAMSMERNADGTWSGPHTLKISKARAVIQGRPNRVDLKADAIGMSGVYDKISIEVAQKAREKIRALLAAQKTPVPADQVRKLIVDAARSLRIFPDNYSAHSEISGLSIDYDPGLSTAAAAHQPVHIALSKMAGESNFKGLKQPSGSVDVNASLDSLQVTGVQAPLDGLIPGSANFSLKFENLPMQDIGRIFDEVMTAAANDSAQGKQMPEDIRQSLQSLPKIMAATKTSFTVTNTYIKARDLSAAFEGRLDASASSPLGGVGKMVFSLIGLDEFLDRVKSLASSNPLMLASTQGMVPFQLMGRYEKGADGISVRKYEIEFVPEGKILVNGLDLAAPRNIAAPDTSGSPTPVGQHSGAIPPVPSQRAP
jgi:hypothetical protein